MKSQFALARAQVVLARAIRRGILLAVSAGLIAVPTAAAVTYPTEGGNGFDGDAQGWSGTDATCSPNAGGLCTESNFFSGSQGNPAGSIESQMTVFANAGDLFTANATWRSPTFTATAIGSGSLVYDRQLDATGLAQLQPTATIDAVLVDESTGQARSLGSEVVDSASETTLDDGTAAFAANTEVMPTGTFELGHDYRLELRSTTTTNSAQAGLTGSTSLRFDNVALNLKNSGPGGSSASRGVRFTGHPISLRKFKRLASRTHWAANRGNRPGGSTVPLKQCTIVGTSKGDHIHGSSGNDVICGLGGNDTIDGGGGHDIIDGGSGNDRLTGSASSDVLAGLAGRDRVKGGSGSDRVGGGAAGDTLSGGPSRDRVNGGAGKDRAVGARHDRVTRVERGV
jgi:Ca2+-binding RTX toxin-like protein